METKKLTELLKACHKYGVETIEFEGLRVAFKKDFLTRIETKQNNEILAHEMSAVQEKTLDSEDKKSKLDAIAALVIENPALLEELEASNALTSTNEDFDEET